MSEYGDIMDVVLNFVDFSADFPTEFPADFGASAYDQSQNQNQNQKSPHASTRHQKYLLDHLQIQHEQQTQYTQYIKSEIMILEEELLMGDLTRMSGNIGTQIKHLEDQLTIESKKLHDLNVAISEFD